MLLLMILQFLLSNSVFVGTLFNCTSPKCFHKFFVYGGQILDHTKLKMFLLKTWLQQAPLLKCTHCPQCSHWSFGNGSSPFILLIVFHYSSSLVSHQHPYLLHLYCKNMYSTCSLIYEIYIYICKYVEYLQSKPCG